MTPPTPRRQALTVAVLTLDEAEFIGRCLDAVWWADDVLVLDSGSTDGTQEIARAHGARVVEQPWLGWAPQREQATRLARHDWVLFLDADELPDETLARALRELDLQAADPTAGYSVDRRGDWFGVLLPNDQRARNRSSFVRLFHRAHSAYDPAVRVHERVDVPSGRLVALPGVLLHWRAATARDYVAMVNRYSDIEAEVALDAGRPGSFTRVLAMPLVRFTWVYLVRGNVWLGRRGLLHALHSAWAEYVRRLKAWEAVHAPRVAHPPDAYHPERRPPHVDALAPPADETQPTPRPGTPAPRPL